MSSRTKKHVACTFCGDPKVFEIPDAKGKVLKFCEDCLTTFMMEAVKALAHRLPELLG